MKYLALIAALLAGSALAQEPAKIPERISVREELEAVAPRLSGSREGQDLLLTQNYPDDPRPTRWQLTVPDRVPACELVSVEVAAPGNKAFDVFVMGVRDGAPLFLTAVQVVEDDPATDEFVFTGPPGKYGVRVTSYQEGRGFVVATRNIEIVGSSTPTGPVDPGTPTDPTNPDPPTGDKPPPEGVYGFGPVAYEAVLKVPGGASGAVKLLENYEWAANSPLAFNELLAELNKRNAAAYVPEANWAQYRAALKEHSDRLTENGILPPTLEDYRIVFKEIASGLRAALGAK